MRVTASSALFFRVVVPRHARCPRRAAVAARLDHGRSRALHEAAHHVLAGRVGRRVEGRHQLVGGVERQRGQPREPLPAGFDVEPRLVGQHEQGALGRVADDLAVHELGVAGDDVREDGIVDRGGGPGGVVDLALEAVADARDRVAVDGVDAARRRSSGSSSACPVLSELIAEVDPSVSTDVRSLTMAFSPASSLAPAERITWSTVGSAVGIAAMASAMAVMNRVSADWPLEQAEREHHDHRPEGRRADPQRHGVQLLGQRRLLLGRPPPASRRSCRPRRRRPGPSRAWCRCRA